MAFLVKSAVKLTNWFTIVDSVFVLLILSVFVKIVCKSLSGVSVLKWEVALVINCETDFPTALSEEQDFVDSLILLK